MSRRDSRRRHRERERAQHLATQAAPPPPPAAPLPTTPALLYTVHEIAAALRVSRATVDRLQARGELPGKLKIGGQVRYLRDVIDQWLLRKSETRQDGNQAQQRRSNQQGRPIHGPSV